MVTSKRKYQTERDRFGGYGTESARLVIDDAVPTRHAAQPSSVYSTELPKTNIVIPDAQRESHAPQQSGDRIYSTYAQAPTAAPETELPKREVKQKQPRDKEDIMPSLKTQAYAKKSVNTEKTAAPERSDRRAIDPKTKVLLVVYVAVALVLAIAVIATGVSISGAQAETAALSESIAYKQSVIAEQQARLAELTNEENIRISAAENGMVEAGDAQYTANRADKVNREKPLPHTNGFDKFCDKLSQLLM